MCGHQRDSMCFTLSFIKMSRLKIWSDDRQCKLEDQKNKGIKIENAARNFAHIYIYKLFP